MLNATLCLIGMSQVTLLLAVGVASSQYSDTVQVLTGENECCHLADSAHIRNWVRDKADTGDTALHWADSADIRPV